MTVGQVHAPRQARSHDKLERLLAAGRELFAERGFDGTRIADVADRAGCSVGVFYQRFEDKDAFFLAVQERFIADALTAVEAVFAADRARPRPAYDVVADWIRIAVGFFRENEGLHHAFLHYEATHSGAEGPMLALAGSVSDRAAAAFVAAVDHDDPELGTRFAGQVVRGVLVHMVLHDSSPLSLHDERLVPELTRMITRYLGLRGPRRRGEPT